MRSALDLRSKIIKEIRLFNLFSYLFKEIHYYLLEVTYLQTFHILLALSIQTTFKICHQCD